MLIKEKFNAFVVRWLVSYYWKPIEKVQGSNLIGWKGIIVIKLL